MSLTQRERAVETTSEEVIQHLPQDYMHDRDVHRAIATAFRNLPPKPDVHTTSRSANQEREMLAMVLVALLVVVYVGGVS